MKFKFLTIITFVLCLAQPLIAQTVDKISYPLVISFQSECCGVPSDSSLRSFIRSFKKQYKIKKIKAFEIGPMGREGEYYLAFKLKELNKKQQAYFISRVKRIKKLPSDKGSWSFMEKKEIDPDAIPKRATTREMIY